MSLRAKVLSGLRWIAIARFSTQLISWASYGSNICFVLPDD